MLTTTNYLLKKPAGTDVVDISNFNDNADILDAQLKINADAVASKETPAGAQAKVDTHSGDTTKHITGAERTAWNSKATSAQGTKADNAIPLSAKGVAGGVASYDAVASSLADYTTHKADDVRHIYHGSLSLTADLNTITGQGTYAVNDTTNMTNKPVGVNMSYSILEVSTYSYVVQKLYNVVYGESYFRVRNQASTWSPWSRILTDTNFGLGSRVYHSLNQSIANNIPTVLAFNSESFNDAIMHSFATNNSRLTCNQSGKYLIQANIYFENNSVGLRELDILVNGSNVAVLQESAITGGGKISTISATIKLNIGDYVEIRVSQSSGSAINVIANGYSPYFSAIKVGV